MPNSTPGSGIGPEYQVYDTNNIPASGREDKKGILVFGSLYDLIPAKGARLITQDNGII